MPDSHGTDYAQAHLAATLLLPQAAEQPAGTPAGPVHASKCAVSSCRWHTECSREVLLQLVVRPPALGLVVDLTQAAKSSWTNQQQKNAQPKNCWLAARKRCKRCKRTAGGTRIRQVAPQTAAEAHTAVGTRFSPRCAAGRQGNGGALGPNTEQAVTSKTCPIAKCLPYQQHTCAPAKVLAPRVVATLQLLVPRRGLRGQRLKGV